MELNIVVAMTDTGLIGVNNSLPWHLPEDLKQFKARTLGHPMIMGRLTYDSIGRPLPGRLTVVLTGNKDWNAPEGVRVAHTLDDALALAEACAEELGVAQIMIVGGARVYEQFLPKVKRLFVTEVHTQLEGDAYFPEIDRRIWVETSRQRYTSEGASALEYSFVEYLRRENG